MIRLVNPVVTLDFIRSEIAAGNSLPLPKSSRLSSRPTSLAGLTCRCSLVAQRLAIRPFGRVFVLGGAGYLVSEPSVARVLAGAFVQIPDADNPRGARQRPLTPTYLRATAGRCRYAEPSETTITG